jgi:G3E family GTPase
MINALFIYKAPVACAVSDKLRSSEDLVRLSGGCACCSLRKDVVKALADLRSRGAATGGYSNILIETTGLADPGPIAFTFFAHPWIRKVFRLDSIVYASPPAPT